MKNVEFIQKVATFLVSTEKEEIMRSIWAGIFPSQTLLNSPRIC